MRATTVGIAACCTLLFACTATREKRWEQRQVYVQDCRDRWQRSAPVDTVPLTVIYAQAGFRFDLEVLPNFLIGTTPNGDTVGMVDLLWPPDSLFADTMVLVPHPWTPAEMTAISPAHQVFSDRRINRLYCGVRQLYYGRLTRP